MHKYIFQDIYEWAGKIRTINIEKEEPALGGLSIEYLDKAKIEGDLSDALKKMAPRSWANLSLDDRAKCFQKIYRQYGKYMVFVKAIPGLPWPFVASLLRRKESPLTEQFLRNIARTSGLRLSLTQQYSTI